MGWIKIRKTRIGSSVSLFFFVLSNYWSQNEEKDRSAEIGFTYPDHTINVLEFWVWSGKLSSIRYAFMILLKQLSSKNMSILMKVYIIFLQYLFILFNNLYYFKALNQLKSAFTYTRHLSPRWSWFSNNQSNDNNSPYSDFTLFLSQPRCFPKYTPLAWPIWCL